jgi:hypothetical protein
MTFLDFNEPIVRMPVKTKDTTFVFYLPNTEEIKKARLYDVRSIISDPAYTWVTISLTDKSDDTPMKIDGYKVWVNYNKYGLYLSSVPRLFFHADFLDNDEVKSFATMMLYTLILNDIDKELRKNDLDYTFTRLRPEMVVEIIDGYNRENDRVFY